MNPVKKLSILICLAATFAGAAGYWFFVGDNSQKNESPLSFDKSFQSKPAGVDSKDQLVSTDQATIPDDVSSLGHANEFVKRSAPQELNATKTRSSKFAKRRSAAETLKAENSKDETEMTQTFVDSEPPLKTPDSGSTFVLLEEPNTEEGSLAPEGVVASADVSQEKTKNDEQSKTVWLSLGAGVSFSSLAQDVPGSSELNVGKFSAPFLFLEIGAWLTKAFGFEFSYQSLPGKVLSSASLEVSKEEYIWKTMSAELNYRMSYLSSDSEWIFKLGLQQHEIPFLHPQSASEISLFENSMTTASIGLQYRRRLGLQTYFEGLIRYQHPVHTTSVTNSMIEVKSPLILDGEVGATYCLNQNLSVGGYWSVQYLSYRYQFSESSSDPAQNGKQTLMQSNLNLRLRWEF